MALNTFNITRSQDIRLSDAQLRQQYIQYFVAGNVSAAQAIITNNPQLFSKVITPELIQPFVDGILSLENNYKNAVTDYLAALLTTFQSDIDNIKKIGTYVSGTSYVVGNFVIYSNDLYLCIKDGTYPITDTTAWLLLGLQGEEGQVGSGVMYIGEWDSATQYQQYQLVSYDNNLYVSKTATTGNQPDTSPDKWFLAFTVVERGIMTGANVPLGIGTGDMWWQYIT